MLTKTDSCTIFDSLVKGLAVDRYAAQKALIDPDKSIDRVRLQKDIIEALSKEYYPGKENQDKDPSIAETRSWLISTLGRLSGDNGEAANVVKKHLDPGYEKDKWVRFWALEGLLAAAIPDLETIAQRIAEDETEPLVRKLAVAVLASKGDSRSMQEIEDELEKGPVHWATIHALRFVPIKAAVKPLCEIVEKGGYDGNTYQAIMALGKIPSSTPQAERSARTLADFVYEKRHSTMSEGLRKNALFALGNLKVESIAPVLVDELMDDNPAIVREAARALEKVLGIRTSTARIVESAGKVGHIEGFARALRWMNRESVVEELEAIMVSGPPDKQDIARALLSEIGGEIALQKLLARKSAMDQFTAMLEKAEEKIRNLFETSIQDARRGYKLAVYMDLTVFAVGIFLILLSALLVFLNEGKPDNLVGAGLTGGTGALGILYSTLVANPRRQVQEAVDHLMYLKVIFLAYLRQLHQTDQAYTRRLLDEDKLTYEEMDRFSTMVEMMMHNAVNQLTLISRLDFKTQQEQISEELNTTDKTNGEQAENDSPPVPDK